MVQLNRTSALSKSDSWVVSMVSFDIFCAPPPSSVNVNPRNLFNNQVEKKLFLEFLYIALSLMSAQLESTKVHLTKVWILMGLLDVNEPIVRRKHSKIEE